MRFFSALRMTKKIIFQPPDRGRRPIAQPFRSSGAFPQPPGFSHPDRGAGGVEVFQEGDGKFPAGLGQVLELVDGNFPVLLEEINERRLEGLDGGLVEIEVFFHLDQPALVDQDLEELFDLSAAILDASVASLKVGGEKWPRR